MALVAPLFLSAPAPAAEPSPPVILCFGDSLTEGYHVAARFSYPARLQERLRQRGYDFKIVNAGVSGDTTDNGLERVHWSLTTRPAIVILALGANDGFRHQDVARMEANLAQLIETFQDKGARVILAGMRLPANYGRAYGEQFASVFPRLAQRYDLPLLPFLLDGVALDPELNLADGIHPNEAGYAVVMENVWKVLEPELSKLKEH